MSDRLLDQVVVVLDQPQNVVNIAAVIRAMKNMGVSKLRLVNPADFDPSRDGNGRVALLFGREDRGLENAALDLCHSIVVIPTDPDYSSLNLAQAVMVILYEVLMASELGEQELPRRGRRANERATREDLEFMFGALEKGLGRIEFFKARKSQAVITTLRTIFARADIDQRESRLVAAIGFEIGHFIDRLEENLRKELGGADDG